MSRSLRSATKSDLPPLEIIRRQAIEANFSSRYPREAYADLVASPDADLRTYIECRDYVTIVAETPVTPVAYATGRSTDGELLAVYTSPDYERRGYGRQVLEETAERLRTEDIERLSVWTPEPAQPFFAACGFERVGEIEEATLPKIRMERLVADA